MNSDTIERILLYNIISDSNNHDYIEKLSDILFTAEDTKTVFSTIKKLYEEGKPIDFPYLGQISYLNLSAIVKQRKVNDVEKYIKLLKENYNKRQLIAFAEDIRRREDVSYDEVYSRLLELQPAHDRDVSDIKTAVSEYTDHLMKIVSGQKRHGLQTGIEKFDIKTGGFGASELIILAARPGVGKTSLAVSIIKNVVLSGKSVLFFSVEMSRAEIINKLVAMISGVSSFRLRMGSLTKPELEKTVTALNSVRDCKMFIDDTPGIDIAELRIKAKKIKKEHDIDLLVVDYLQLVRAKARSRIEEVSKISRMLKELAKELDIPVLALSQLNRNVDNRGGDNKPKLSDLRESGAIEQDADMVIFIHNGEYEMKEIIIAKYRHGSTGNFVLSFDSSTTEFFEPQEEEGFDEE